MFNIEYDRWVLKTGIGPFSTPFYFGFAEWASNNLTDPSGQPVRELFCPYAGHGYHFMQQVIRGSQDCETQSLVWHGKDHPTLPETYISGWRKARNLAVSLEDYLEEAGRLAFTFQNLVETLESVRPGRTLDEAFGIIEKTDGIRIDDRHVEVLVTPDNIGALKDLLERTDSLGIRNPDIWLPNFSPEIYKEIRAGRQQAA